MKKEKRKKEKKKRESYAVQRNAAFDSVPTQ
jgi:hypothetical protein